MINPYGAPIDADAQILESDLPTVNAAGLLKPGMSVMEIFDLAGKIEDELHDQVFEAIVANTYPEARDPEYPAMVDSGKVLLAILKRMTPAERRALKKRITP